MELTGEDVTANLKTIEAIPLSVTLPKGYQNGKTIIDNKEIPGITGGAVDSREAMPGPIYLQGSEKGHVAFRNILITPAQ